MRTTTLRVATAPPATVADTVYANGRIYTVDEDQPWAEAVAIRDGRFIIVGSAPGAMASNVIVYLAGGALAFSITMTTLATFLSPLLTPSLVKWLGGAFMPVAFWPLFVTIVQTVLVPLLAGMGLRRLLGRQLERAELMCPGIAAVAIVVICSYAVAANQPRIASVGPTVFGYVVLLNALGYLAGWFLAKLYRFDHRHRLALSIEIGMQNAGLGVALALSHFRPETALPGALFAAWCVLTAAGASSFLRHRLTSTPEGVH